jgi:hypothetical protein
LIPCFEVACQYGCLLLAVTSPLFAYSGSGVNYRGMEDTP